jgi:hypothetical protein
MLEELLGELRDYRKREVFLFVLLVACVIGVAIYALDHISNLKLKPADHSDF